MKASDDLFLLIQSLSKSEKRYFKLFNSKYHSKKENNYIRLFDAIEKQTHTGGQQGLYNENIIKEEFKNTTFIKHLPSEKNYLYHLILESLSVFHSENSAEARLRKIMNQAEILLKKKLIKQYSKLIIKARQIALENELHFSTMNILSSEIEREADPERIKDLYTRQQKNVEIQNNLSEYQFLSRQLGALHLKTGTPRTLNTKKKFEKLSQNLLLKDEKEALSVKAKNYFFAINSLICRINNDTLGFYENSKKALKNLEDHPVILQQDQSRYLRMLNNYFVSCLELKKWDSVFEYITKLKHFDAKTTEVEVKKFVLLFTYTTGAYISTGNFDKGAILVEELKEDLNKYMTKLAIHEEIIFYINIALIYFGKKEYKTSVTYIHRILNCTEKFREELYSMAKIFLLILYFEMKKLDLLEYSLISTYRYLLKRDRLHKFEKIIVDFIRKNSSINERNSVAEYKELRREFIAISTDPLENEILNSLNIISWVESKIENRDFAEIVREKAFKN